MTQEDPRKRVAEERKIRIDHSEVYFENDRLAEQLDLSLDHLTRKSHRQVINKDHEIRQLRKNLSQMNLIKRPSAVTSLRPHTSPSVRRLIKPPPVIVKLDVRVPADKGDISDDNAKGENDVSVNDDDDDGDVGLSEEDKRLRRQWRQQRRRVQSSEGRGRGRGKGDEENGEEEEKGMSVLSRVAETAKRKIQRVTREQILLQRLDMTAIPQTWYTQVHCPPDILQLPSPQRAASARPSAATRFSSRPSTTPTNNRRGARSNNKNSNNPKVLLNARRAKSAASPSSTTTTAAVTTTITFSDDFITNNNDDSALIGGGRGGVGELQLEEHQQKTTEAAMRSRRQLRELTGDGVGVGVASRWGGAAGEWVGGAEGEERRGRFLEAVRLERQRLEARVRVFLQDCDTVGVAGISSRRDRDYQTLLLPHTL